MPMTTISQSREAKKRASSQLEDQAIILGEPYDGSHDRDIVGDKIGGNGGGRKKQKRRATMAEQQREQIKQLQEEGWWWPEKYAPQNPTCEIIIPRMNAVIKRFKANGYNPECLWFGEDAYMIKAMDDAGPRRVTQRILDRINYPFPVRESKKRTATAEPELQRNNSNAIGSDTQYVATDATALPLPDRDDWDESPLSSKHSMFGSHNDKLLASPNRPVSVDSNEGFPTPPTQSPVSGIISRLRGDKCLQSNDIHRCVGLLRASTEWHIFDPGFPFQHSILSKRRTVSANNLIFFINAKNHWSLCHMDRRLGLLKHYNSLPSEMPVNDLKSWILEQPAIRLTSELSIREEKCPQQEDGFNCGIFTLAVLQALLNGNSIPSEVNANNLRSTFAEQLESLTISELVKPSSEAASPGMQPIGRRASFEQNHSDAHNFGLLDESGEHEVEIFDILSHLDEFEKGFGKANANLTKNMKGFEKQKGKVVEMLKEQDALEQKLKNEQRLADDLAGKVEKSQVEYKGAREWLNQHSTGGKVEPSNTLLNRIISDAESTIQSWAAEIDSNKERLEILQAKCDEYEGTMQELQVEILYSTKQRDVMEKKVKRKKDSLAHVDGIFAKIAVSRGFTKCKD
ncbi:Sentrin sumo-specific [Fusarium sp. NRRL 52700]|nr:Sentrin sumo-specific [Fusarium sp. NRRL 52700]